MDEPAVGIPYHSVFRDTGAPYTHVLRPLNPDPSLHLGSVQSDTRLTFPGPRLRFPLLERGFEPKDADLKLGPLFLKLRALTAGILFSDNIHHSNENRESDVIGIVRLGITAIVQLTEGLHVAVTGNLVWLPFENKFGIAGFGLFAPYDIALDGSPLLHSQVTWETKIGAWDVVFSDDFTIDAARITAGDRDTLDIFEGGQFNEVDRAGRYAFRAPGRNSDSHHRNIDDNTEAEILYYSNKIGVEAERLLPGPVRLRVGAYHENLWYNQGNRGLPRLRDVVNASIYSERENQRFKPFAAYRGVHTDQIDGFRHEIRLGINGPITDQLFLHADVGLFHQDDNGTNRFLYGLQLRHIAGPYTTETLTLRRHYNDLSNELRDDAIYHIEQVLGPKIRAAAFVSYSEVADLSDDGYDRTEWRTGVRFTLDPGPRTTIQLSGLYTDRRYNSDDLGHHETYTARLHLTYRFTDTLVARLLYQYQTRDSSRERDNFDENLVFLTVTKYFD